jgi:hypothetical protein
MVNAILTDAGSAGVLATVLETGTMLTCGAIQVATVTLPLSG